MVNVVREEDDDSFFDYSESVAVDPGNSIIFATLIFCILVNIILPLFIFLANERDRKRRDAENAINLEPKDDKALAHTDEPSELQEEETDCLDEYLGETKRHRYHPSDGQSVISKKSSVYHTISADYSVYSGSAAMYSVTSSLQSTLTPCKPKFLKSRHRVERAVNKQMILSEAEGLFLERMPPVTYLTGTSRQPSFSQVSCLEKLKPDEVSFNDALDVVKKEPLAVTYQADIDDAMDVDLGEGWWDCLISIAEWDHEMKRIFKLGVPFVTQALSTGLLDTMTVAVLGRLIGTREVSAYVVVGIVVDVSVQVVGGFHECLATLCSQAVGVRNEHLAGQYIQLSVLLFVTFWIPFIIIWMTYMTDIILWFGFDEETARIGQEFLIYTVLTEMVNGIGEAVHGLLDVINLENYSTLVGAAEEALTFIYILLSALFSNATLTTVGIIELSMATIFLLGNICYIYYKGWFQKYLDGMIYSYALLNGKAVYLMMKTSLSLSLGYLFTEGEWEILAFFASVLGPAEVAAWGIIGTLWSAVEDVIEAVGDAAEVRCAFLLGAGLPEKAELSTYKSMFISVSLSFILTSCIFIAGQDLATMMTDDRTLQRMITDILPLFGLGNIALTWGSLSWTLLGAQGRYQMATIIGFCGSWLVTMPLAALSTIVLKVDLRGQTGAIVVGYTISGALNTFILVRSDWKELSANVRRDNRKSDSDSSVSSSSSSSSSDSESTLAASNVESSKSSPPLKASSPLPSPSLESPNSPDSKSDTSKLDSFRSDTPTSDTMSSDNSKSYSFSPDPFASCDSTEENSRSCSSNSVSRSIGSDERSATSASFVMSSPERDASLSTSERSSYRREGTSQSERPSRSRRWSGSGKSSRKGLSTLASVSASESGWSFVSSNSEPDAPLSTQSERLSRSGTSSESEKSSKKGSSTLTSVSESGWSSSTGSSSSEEDTVLPPLRNNAAQLCASDASLNNVTSSYTPTSSESQTECERSQGRHGPTPDPNLAILYAVKNRSLPDDSERSKSNLLIPVLDASKGCCFHDKSISPNRDGRDSIVDNNSISKTNDKSVRSGKSVPSHNPPPPLPYSHPQYQDTERGISPVNKNTLINLVDVDEDHLVSGLGLSSFRNAEWIATYDPNLEPATQLTQGEEDSGNEYVEYQGNNII